MPCVCLPVLTCWGIASNLVAGEDSGGSLIAEAPAQYRPRHPERTACYRLFQDHFDSYFRAYEQRFEPRSAPPVAAGNLESLESQARSIARPAMAMAMDALQQRPVGTLAMGTPSDPRSGETLVMLDPLEWIHRITAHIPGPEAAYAAVLWRLLQPRQDCRRGQARRIRPRGASPPLPPKTPTLPAKHDAPGRGY